ncbi:hypothetical protein [Yoonia sp. MH D7]
MDVPRGSDWSVDRVSDGFSVKVEGVTEYETADVFSRISTSRITKIENKLDSGKLLLFSDCDCHATAFLWRPDKLVIDVNDGQALAGAINVIESTPKPEALTLPVLALWPTDLTANVLNFAPVFDFSERSKT